MDTGVLKYSCPSLLHSVHAYCARAVLSPQFFTVHICHTDTSIMVVLPREKIFREPTTNKEVK